VLLAVTRRAGQGAYSQRYHSPLTVAGLYWHFVDLIGSSSLPSSTSPGGTEPDARTTAQIAAVLAGAAGASLADCAPHQPLGPLNLPIALLIATTKALIVASIFMELCEGSGLMRAFAAAGFFWLFTLIWLAGSDFLTRPGFPPALSNSQAHP
jgi:caa(3)-type oxidase subunit IV